MMPNLQSTPGLLKHSGAVISSDGTYRYALSRVWDTDRTPLLIIGLNPSTADATTDDPTIRRCVGFAERWGHGALLMGNLYAFRATEPASLLAQGDCDMVGPYNDLWLSWMASVTDEWLAAWGASGGSRAGARAHSVRRIIGRPGVCLGTTKAGHPRHPLYVRATQPRIPY